MPAYIMGMVMDKAAASAFQSAMSVESFLSDDDRAEIYAASLEALYRVWQQFPHLTGPVVGRECANAVRDLFTHELPEIESLIAGLQLKPQ